jgi:hypothetical protein
MTCRVIPVKPFRAVNVGTACRARFLLESVWLGMSEDDVMAARGRSTRGESKSAPT